MAKPLMPYAVVGETPERFQLRRRDGRVIRVSRARMKDLRRQGRITENRLTDRSPTDEGSRAPVGL